MDVIERPNGVCTVVNRRGIPHGDKLSVNGVPTCLKCQAAAERANRTAIPVVTARDPGHNAMKEIVRGIVPADNNPTITLMPVDGNQPLINYASTPVISKAIGNWTLQDIKSAIDRLPMPRSLKQYKRLQKIQQLIGEAMREELHAAD